MADYWYCITCGKLMRTFEEAEEHNKLPDHYVAPKNFPLAEGVTPPSREGPLIEPEDANRVIEAKHYVCLCGETFLRRRDAFNHAKEMENKFGAHVIADHLIAPMPRGQTKFPEYKDDEQTER